MVLLLALLLSCKGEARSKFKVNSFDLTVQNQSTMRNTTQCTLKKKSKILRRGACVANLGSIKKENLEVQNKRLSTHLVGRRYHQ